MKDKSIFLGIIDFEIDGENYRYQKMNGSFYKLDENSYICIGNLKSGLKTPDRVWANWKK